MVAWYPELHTFWMERRCVRDVARPLLQASFQGVCPERQNFTSSALKEIKKKKKNPIRSSSLLLVMWDFFLGTWRCVHEVIWTFFPCHGWKEIVFAVFFLGKVCGCPDLASPQGFFSLFYFLYLFMFPFYEMLKAAATAVQLRRNTNTSCDCRAGRRGFKTSRVRQRRALFLPKNKINK